jgi:hypothetical protein
MEMIKAESVIPESAGVCYHVISKKWFDRWQAYTRCAVDSEGNTTVTEADENCPHPGLINGLLSELRNMSD